MNVGENTAVYHVINWLSPGMRATRAATSPQDAVRAFYGDWSQATATRGAEGYASFFADDAVLLPPNAAPVSGRAAIRDWQERSQKDATYRAQPEGVSEDELQVSGGFVIYRSTLKGQRVPKAGGEPEPFENKYFDVLRRKSRRRLRVHPTDVEQQPPEVGRQRRGLRRRLTVLCRAFEPSLSGGPSIDLERRGLRCSCPKSWRPWTEQKCRPALARRRQHPHVAGSDAERGADTGEMTDDEWTEADGPDPSRAGDGFGVPGGCE